VGESEWRTAVTYDPNDDRRIDILRKRDESMSGALMGGIAIVLLLLFGFAIFTLGSRNADTVATDKTQMERTAPSTTGQGGMQGSGWSTPGRDQNTISPAPPVSPSPTAPK
jgi:hypothetical protein